MSEAQPGSLQTSKMECFATIIILCAIIFWSVIFGEILIDFRDLWVIYPFHAIGLFLYPLKASQNHRFSGGGYRKRPVACNGITRKLCEVCLFFTDSLLLLLGNFLPADITFILKHFRPIFPFYTLWKHQKKPGFLVFSGGIKWEYWSEMG